MNIVSHCLVVLGARFSGDNRADLVLKSGIPCRSQSNGLRKERGISGACNTVQPFAPVVVLGDAKPGDGRGMIVHLLSLLLERHARDQRIDALIQRL